MVEQGLVMLIQAGLGSPPMAPGGWPVQLPKDQISDTKTKAWVFKSIVDDATITLDGEDGLTGWHVQIDCHGYTMADATTLARAIRAVLRGFSGVLPDPDHTVVQGVFRTGPALDGFSDSSRSYVRSLEYLIQYDQD